MKWRALAVGMAILGLTGATAAYAVPCVIISEVYYDHLAFDNDWEWIELYNQSDQAIDLSDYWLGAGGISYDQFQFSLSGTILPGQTFVIGGPNGDAVSGNPSFDLVLNFLGGLPNPGTTNTMRAIGLFDMAMGDYVDGTSTPFDAVFFGDQPNVNTFLDVDGSIATFDVGDSENGNSIERISNTGDWVVQLNPNPGSANDNLEIIVHRQPPPTIPEPATLTLVAAAMVPLLMLGKRKSS